MDHQGSTRALMDGTGNVISRHDYLPFGEELWAGTGMRTATQKFGAMDQSRMRYGLTEKDEATGLDHTWFRKHENNSGRWTTPDPIGGNPGDPQSFNRYSYSLNDPVNLVDPSGLMTCEPGYYGPECDSSSLGRWGGGFDMNERHSNLNPTGREIIMGNFGLDVRYIARFRSLQWTDDEGEEHVTFWWERMPQGYTHFGGNSFILVRSGGRHEEPRVFAQEVPRLIAEGQAWDKWYAWVNCNTPIMDKYNSQLDNFHKIGGEAFWAEVGVGIAAGTVVASGGLKTTIPDEGVPVGVWGVVLMGALPHTIGKGNA